MKRIRPEVLLRRYVSKGVKPIRKSYRTPRGCCGLTAYFCAAKEIKNGIRTSYVFLTTERAEKLGFDERYVAGFTVGFDGGRAKNITGIPFRFLPNEMKQGWRDGRDCWRAVRHLA